MSLDFKIKYFDYKNFENFLSTSFKGSKEYINPLNLFRLDPSKIENKINTKEYIKTFFNGRLIEIPDFKLQNNTIEKYSRFEDYTKINEVDHLSLWALAALDTIFSKYKDLKLGKELEILQSQNPRDGRLDLVAKINEKIIFFESKTTVKSALNENRFVYQIPGYIKEGQMIIKKHNLSISFKGILLIGGEESDAYPAEHIDCTTGQIGNLSEIFFHKLNEKNIHFFSANALWCLTTLSLILDKSLNVDKFFSFLEKNNYIGLVSAGIIIQKKNQFLVQPFNFQNFLDL